jgi:hypothetical protein
MDGGQNQKTWGSRGGGQGACGNKPIIGSTLYAVIADTPEQAEAAVEAVAPPDSIVVVTGGPLKPETVERLALVPGEPKEIG